MIVTTPESMNYYIQKDPEHLRSFPSLKLPVTKFPVLRNGGKVTEMLVTGPVDTPSLGCSRRKILHRSCAGGGVDEQASTGWWRKSGIKQSPPRNKPQNNMGRPLLQLLILIATFNTPAATPDTLLSRPPMFSFPFHRQ